MSEKFDRDAEADNEEYPIGGWGHEPAAPTPIDHSGLVRELRADAAVDERSGIPGAFFERRIATLRRAASAIEALQAERDALAEELALLRSEAILPIEAESRARKTAVALMTRDEEMRVVAAERDEAVRHLEAVLKHVPKACCEELSPLTGQPRTGAIGLRRLHRSSMARPHQGAEVSAQPATAFERAARYEAVCLHRDQHRDVAKATRLGWGPVWCWVCGFTVRIKAQK